jgi:type I restriction enzyme, S subunit
MSEWSSILLEDLSDDITVGFVGSMTQEYVETGIPFLRSKNIEPYRINVDDLRYISEEFGSVN